MENICSYEQYISSLSYMWCIYLYFSSAFLSDLSVLYIPYSKETFISHFFPTAVPTKISLAQSDKYEFTIF